MVRLRFLARFFALQAQHVAHNLERHGGLVSRPADIDFSTDEIVDLFVAPKREVNVQPPGERLGQLRVQPSAAVAAAYNL